MTAPEDREDIDDGSEEEETDEAPQRPPGHQRKPKPNKRGAGAIDPKKFYRASGGVGTGEAEQTWNDLVAWLPTQNLSPRDVSISFHRTHPPSPNGPVFVGRVGGEAIAGGGELTPGQALVDYAMRFAHIGTGAAGPAAYNVYFGRKADGQSITTSSVAMPDVQTCRNIINAQDQADAGQPGVAAPRIPMPMGPPAQAPFSFQPQQQWAPPPGYGNPYGNPMPPQAPAPPDAGLMSELSYLRGALGEALSAAREGRQPNIPAPPGVAAPVVNEEALAQKVTAQVLMALQTAGVFKPAVAAPPAPPPTVAAPPPPPVSTGGLAKSLEGMVGRLMENIINNAGKTMERSISQATGMGAPPKAPEEEEPEAPEEKPAPRNPEDDIPWTVAEVPGAKWSDGRPIIYAKDKESEEISPLGVFMSNPVIAERAMDLANGLGNAMKDAIVKFTQGPAAVPARVVKEIPAGAIDGGVGSVPPMPNGAPPSQGGWEAP